MSEDQIVVLILTFVFAERGVIWVTNFTKREAVNKDPFLIEAEKEVEEMLR